MPIELDVEATIRNALLTGWTEGEMCRLGDIPEIAARLAPRIAKAIIAARCPECLEEDGHDKRAVEALTIPRSDYPTYGDNLLDAKRVTATDILVERAREAIRGSPCKDAVEAALIALEHRRIKQSVP